MGTNIQKYEPSRLAAIGARDILSEIDDPSIAANFVHASKETSDLAKKIAKATQDEEEAWLTAFEWEHTWLEGIRHAGTLLASMDEFGEKGGDRKSSNRTLLEDIGIEKIQSSRWQRIASIHPEDFRVWVEDQREHGNQLTMSGALRLLAKEPDWKPLPDGTFNVIYADPPWEFSNEFIRRGNGQTADAHYETQKTIDICTLPVSNVCHEETILLLWAPNALMMQDGQMVLDAWGFKYKTNIVWIKPRGPSMGWWVQNRHEICLIGVNKGSSPPLHKPESVIFEGTVKHSQKPDEMYEIIQATWEPPYLELFARRKWNDLWEVWGNEIDT
jgi:N6-adenosine-specific RNA methylase IME4